MAPTVSSGGLVSMRLCGLAFPVEALTVGAVSGYPYYAYDEDNAYQQYASQEQYRQWADYAAQQQYEDSAAQANYYNWAAANSYKQPKKDVLKVASNKNTNKVNFMFFLRMLPAAA